MHNLKRFFTFQKLTKSFNSNTALIISFRVPTLEVSGKRSENDASYPTSGYL